MVLQVNVLLLIECNSDDFLFPPVASIVELIEYQVVPTLPSSVFAVLNLHNLLDVSGFDAIPAIKIVELPTQLDKYCRNKSL